MSFSNEADAHALENITTVYYCSPDVCVCVCVWLWRYLFLFQHMVKPSLSSNLFDKVFGESGQWEHGLPQGILGDLTEEEGLVFEKVGSFVHPHRWAEGREK